MKTMRIEEIYFEYLKWMKKQIGFERGNSFDYNKLLDILNNIEFILPHKHITMDVNRIVDAIDMRSEFLAYLSTQEIYIPIANSGSFFPKKVSVLEVLIALANRCERDIMYNPDYGDRTANWFWIMIENLGLMKYSDTNAYSWHEDDVKTIINIFMNRIYSPNGQGGLFPLKNTLSDQRNIEIWAQMTNYLSERGDI